MVGQPAAPGATDPPPFASIQGRRAPLVGAGPGPALEQARPMAVGGMGRLARLSTLRAEGVWAKPLAKTATGDFDE